MKKYFLAILLTLSLLVAGPAQAVNFGWDAPLPGAVQPSGYTLYFQEDGNVGEVYRKSVTGLTCFLDSRLFKPNVTYRFFVKAHNTYYVSVPSDSITWTRVMVKYEVPEDKLPTTLYPDPAPVEEVVALTVAP